MKKLVLILVAGVSFASAHAQLQFGVKAGANFRYDLGISNIENNSDNSGNFSSTPTGKLHNSVFQLGLRYTLLNGKK